MAAPDTFRLKLSRLFAVFSGSRDGAFIGDDQLQQATINTLDNVVAPPACGPVIAELEADMEGWLADRDASHIRVVVIPPCEQNGIVDIWSQGRGCDFCFRLPRPFCCLRWRRRCLRSPDSLLTSRGCCGTYGSHSKNDLWATCLLSILRRTYFRSHGEFGHSSAAGINASSVLPCQSFLAADGQSRGPARGFDPA